MCEKTNEEELKDGSDVELLRNDKFDNEAIESG